MTCPHCHAQLLPMQSEYFCLQCGESVPRTGQTVDEGVKLEETTDPVLQRAINDVLEHPMTFLPPHREVVKAPEPVSPHPVAPSMVASEPASVPEPLVDTVQAPTVAVTRSVPDPLPKPTPPPSPVMVTAPLSPVAPQPKPAVVPPPPAPIPAAVPVLPPINLRTDNPKPLMNLFKPEVFAPPTRPIDAQALHGQPTRTSTPVQTTWHLPKLHLRLSVRQPRPRSLMHLGLAATVLLVVVSVANAGAAWYLHNRIYPGVKVAGLDLGGQSIVQAASTVTKSNRLGAVTLVVGSTTYSLDPTQLGVTVDEAGAIAKAQAIGHNEAVPLVGLYRSLQSSSVVPGLKIDQDRLNAVLAQLASSISHPASDAAVIMNGTVPILVSDKAGQSVTADDLRSAVIEAITTNEKVVINTTKIPAQTPASVYEPLIAQLQSRIALTIKLSVRGKITAVPSQQIASWLRWNRDGSTIWADPAGVAAYIAGLPGTFDRKALLASLTASINNAKSATMYASTRKITTLATVAPTPVQPVTYHYCIASSDIASDQLAAFVDRLSAVYAAADGWSLGGRIVFVAGAADCNYTVNLVLPSAMTNFSTACADQSTCRIGNDIIINDQRWLQAPSSWKGTQAEYQAELINHETGHWLGFDHAACGSTAPPISQTVATVSGCSAAWWAIPPQLQTLKILPGF